VRFAVLSLPPIFTNSITFNYPVKQIGGTSLRILEVLWRNHYFGPKLGLTLKELAASLPSTTKSGQSLSVPAIRGSLISLSKRALIVAHIMSRGPGSPSEIIRLNVDNVITWPSTATMVLRLFNRDHSMCKKDTFIQDLLTLGWVDQHGNRQLMDMLDHQIRFATSRNYLKTVPEHPDILTTNERVVEECDYLRFVSNQLQVLAPIR